MRNVLTLKFHNPLRLESLKYIVFWENLFYYCQKTGLKNTPQESSVQIARIRETGIVQTVFLKKDIPNGKIIPLSVFENTKLIMIFPLTKSMFIISNFICATYMPDYNNYP